MSHNKFAAGCARLTPCALALAVLLGFTNYVAPASADTDTTPPFVGSITMSPLTLDVTSGSADLTVDAVISDSESGLDACHFDMRGPGGHGLLQFAFDESNGDGDPHNGVYQATLSLAQNSTPGIWSITTPGVECVDKDGNVGSQSLDDLVNDDAGSYKTQVSVTSPGLPRAPTNVVAAPGTRQAKVHWAAPSDNGPISSYTVTSVPGGKSTTVPGTQTHATVALAPGAYRFQVRAKNVNGTGPQSALSNAVTVAGDPVAPKTGYWMLGADGKVYAFGDAHDFGSSNTHAVAMVSRRDGRGYWITDVAGNVKAFGSAPDHGGHPALGAGESVSTISATPSGNGYWLFTDRGRAFAFGDAHAYGDMSGVPLNGPIVASVATASGRGYFMVGSDGGIFAFGDAKFHGSTGGLRLNRPVVGISPTPSGRGYWLVASDGGVFAFDAPFRGSMGGTTLNRPVNGLVAFGRGYLMVASDGGVFSFSDKPFLGSLGTNPPSAPVIGIAAFTT